jgi:competence protein ComEC
VRKLDVLILSHGHHDHAGGAATIAKNIPIGKILVPEGKDSRDLEQLWHVLKSQKIVYKIQTNAIFALKKCIICIIKAPDYREELCEGNESSAVVKICQDGKSILFTGDATEEIEMSTLDKQIASNVLKLSHHGSRTSSAREFLQKVNPQLTIISAGRKNRFGHPHKEVLARLSALGLPYVRTDLEGAIKVVFDGEKSLCYSYNKQPNYF